MLRERFPLIALIAACLIPSASGASEADSLRVRARGADPLELLRSLTKESTAESALAAVTAATDRAIAVDDSAAACALLVTRGIAELRSQQHELGLHTLELAIEWSRAARDSVRWLYALDFSTVGLDALGQSEQSLKTSRTMLELAIAARRPSQEAWARIGIAYVALNASELDDALGGYSRAVELFRSDGNARDELTALVGLGRTHARLGQIDEAKSCYQKVFLVATDIEAHSNAGHALNNLGGLEHRFGDISLAIDYFERAGELYRAGGSAGGIISSAANVAGGWMTLGHYSDAIDVLDAALEVATRDDRRQDVGRLYSKLAWAHLEDGRPRHAEKLFRVAHAMGDTLLSRIRTEATLGLAKSLQEDGKLDEAIDALQRRLELEADSRQQSSLHILLAQLHRRSGRPSEALQHALEALDRAAAFEGDRMRDSILLELSICHREAGELQLAADRFDEALVAIELRRARVSDEDYREARGSRLGPRLVEAAQIVHALPTELTQRERDFRLYDVLKEFKSRTLMERIQLRVQETDNRRTAGEIQSEILSTGELLIEFFVSDQGSWLFAMTPRELRVLRIPGSESDFAGRVSDYVALLATAPDAAIPGASAIGRARQSLGASLLGDIADLVEVAERIIIIPDGYLHSLAFGTLSLPGEASPIVASREVYRVPSTSFLHEPREDAPTSLPPTLVAMAGVNRDGGPLEGARREVDALRRSFVHARSIDGELRAELLQEEFADAAVLHIAAHVDINDENPWHSGILLAIDGDDTRSPDRGDESMQPSVRSLSILSSEDSLRVRESLRGEHFLRAADIASWKLSADLAVLSGCESALGRVTVGEGVIGLGGAFLSAGVRTVVASLWPVDDRQVGALMDEFYDGLARGSTVSAALRGAQLEMRARSETQHPFYWAGFVVIGDGNARVPLVARSQSVATRVMIAGPIVLLLVFIIARHRRRVERLAA